MGCRVGVGEAFGTPAASALSIDTARRDSKFVTAIRLQSIPAAGTTTAN